MVAVAASRVMAGKLCHILPAPSITSACNAHAAPRKACAVHAPGPLACSAVARDAAVGPINIIYTSKKFMYVTVKLQRYWNVATLEKTSGEKDGLVLFHSHISNIQVRDIVTKETSSDTGIHNRAITW